MSRSTPRTRSGCELELAGDLLLEQLRDDKGSLRGGRGDGRPGRAINMVAVVMGTENDRGIGQIFRPE